MKTVRLFALSLAALVGGGAVAPQATASTPTVPVTPVLSTSSQQLGNKVLKKIDEIAAAAADARYIARMEIFAGVQLKKTLEFKMVMKGLEKQLIEFTAPGDVAGMKVLLQDAETLYVYMPEFKKVRRVAAHMKNQGMFGSTFTYEDMSSLALSSIYDAEVKAKKGTETILSLTAKAGIKRTYGNLEVTIDAKKGAVTKIRYFDAKGNAVREQTRENFVEVAKGIAMPMKVSLRNLKSGNSTVVTLSQVAVNQGVEDDTFSRRSLLRG